MKALYALALLGVVVASSLTAGVRVYTVSGNSMYPAMRDGDCVVVAPVSFRHPELGDVVVYDRGDLVAHRVIARGDGYLVTKGDNLSEADGKVGYDRLRGVILLTLPGGRFASAVLQAFCVSSLLLGIYAVVRILLYGLKVE